GGTRKNLVRVPRRPGSGRVRDAARRGGGARGAAAGHGGRAVAGGEPAGGPGAARSAGVPAAGVRHLVAPLPRALRAARLRRAAAGVRDGAPPHPRDHGLAGRGGPGAPHDRGGARRAERVRRGLLHQLARGGEVGGFRGARPGGARGPPLSHPPPRRLPRHRRALDGRLRSAAPGRPPPGRVRGRVRGQPVLLRPARDGRPGAAPPRLAGGAGAPGPRRHRPGRLLPAPDAGDGHGPVARQRAALRGPPLPPRRGRRSGPRGAGVLPLDGAVPVGAGGGARRGFPAPARHPLRRGRLGRLHPHPPQPARALRGAGLGGRPPHLPALPRRPRQRPGPALRLRSDPVLLDGAGAV
ncbi:MAG: putative esterase, partial [uncultured Gemmatimonadetes bacterium]